MSDASFAEFLVQVGSRQFVGLDSDWDKYITDQLLAGVNGSSPGIAKSMKTFNAQVIDFLEKRHSHPWNGKLVNPSDDLQRRSGGGMASIRSASKVYVGSGGDPASIQSMVSTGKMSIHETGGTVRATRAKYLTIPLPAALDRRGVPLRPSARDWPDTFVRKSRRGNLIIFQKRGDGRPTPLYLLKSSVYIRPRLGMEKVWEDYATSRLEGWIVESLEQAFDRVKF